MPEIIDCTDAAAWAAWLERHRADRTEVWIRIAKKQAGIPSVDAYDGTEMALRFGWIDGHRRGLDEQRFLQRYSPRRRRSPWSRLNVERALRLIERGQMQPAGFAAIEAARADGRWPAAG